MTMAKVSAFDSANGAVEYGRELEANGFQAIVTGPVDMVLIDKPGSAIDGWSQSGKTWYLVVGSKKDFTPIE